MESLLDNLDEALKREIVYPPQHLIFRAFNETPPDEVKGLILGMSPYHQLPDQATGLCFEVGVGRIAPSLRIIGKEYETIRKIDDMEELKKLPSHWAKNGILCLNRVLTVKKGYPDSHFKVIGWEWFTEEVIKTVSNFDREIIFLLWGRKAEQVLPFIDQTENHVLITPHPAAELYGRKSKSKFTGSGVFTKANNFNSVFN